MGTVHCFNRLIIDKFVNTNTTYTQTSTEYLICIKYLQRRPLRSNNLVSLVNISALLPGIFRNSRQVTVKTAGAGKSRFWFLGF